MSEINATILIPDISGFTEFMTTTELSHSSLAINVLIDTIVKAVGEEYDVSEIEGDAVLLIKKDPAPSTKEIVAICLKIFNAFHLQRKWMQQHAVCPCKACVGIADLTLKFVVHHGPLAEIKVGHFVKHSGSEMIVAHRLLKNNISNHEYLLMTEKVVQQVNDVAAIPGIDWNYSSEDYASIGKVEYQFALLNEIRRKIPDPVTPENDYRKDDTPYHTVLINANSRKIYWEMMNIPDRNKWLDGLQHVEQEIRHVFVGNTHHCQFEKYHADITPLRMIVSGAEILYAESWQIKELDHCFILEMIFKDVDEHTCLFLSRFMNANEVRVPEEINENISDCLLTFASSLKAHCEQRPVP